MSTAISTDKSALPESIERVLLEGDLSKLNTEDRLTYVAKVCDSLGLNPLTRPLEYIKFQGRMILYARRDCTDQLRAIHDISVEIVDRKTEDGIHIVRARATTPKGRKDEAIGSINVKGLTGEMMANALMKCETKAKRRVTLSICGLGFLDETELEPDRAEVNTEATKAKTLAEAAAILTNTTQPTVAAAIVMPDFEEPPSAPAGPDAALRDTFEKTANDFLARLGEITAKPHWANWKKKHGKTLGDLVSQMEAHGMAELAAKLRETVAAKREAFGDEKRDTVPCSIGADCRAAKHDGACPKWIPK